eukprot:TRINITY_DN49556_c0_g1_i5.p1 TRINITY_DN49556_c0_g1~~TRINITY_DN49556_c0_g1_i5.p1  ORF type:complete len:282 (+),score=-7.53 TRINITY_DN49556_c0_g1_i5:243-1088(+)
MQINIEQMNSRIAHVQEEIKEENLREYQRYQQDAGMVLQELTSCPFCAFKMTLVRDCSKIDLHYWQCPPEINLWLHKKTRNKKSFMFCCIKAYSAKKQQDLFPLFNKMELLWKKLLLIRSQHTNTGREQRQNGRYGHLDYTIGVQLRCVSLQSRSEMQQQSFLLLRKKSKRLQTIRRVSMPVYKALSGMGYANRIINHQLAFDNNSMTKSHIERIWSEIKPLSGFYKVVHSDQTYIQVLINYGVWKRSIRKMIQEGKVYELIAILRSHYQQEASLRTSVYF